jgi:hypothetical protein
LIEKIVAEIDAEIVRLQQVRTLLVAVPAKRGPGRPAKTTTTVKAAPVKAAKRRTLSADAREKIRQGQLKRWATAKKSTKKASK